MNTSTADPLVGQLLDGRYRLDGRVARGGMATVYTGFDTRLDRAVAIKVMHGSLAQDDAFVERFRREAKSAARLQHPNVVSIFDQGEDGGHVYLVMELVAGRTVRAMLREQGALDPATALDVTAGLLTALAAAHDAGIVHRDVKPENVLVTAGGQVKVADFGLARAIEATHHTVTDGTLIGTVAYLAPEQVLSGAADGRTDLYSAGVVLFEMLTGVVPFTGDTPITVAYRHVNDDVPPPSEVRPGLPRSVDDVVVAATRRAPEARYGDARTMLSAVQRARATLSDTEQHTTVVALDEAPTTVIAMGTRPMPAVPAAPDPPVRPRRRGADPARRRKRAIVITVVMGLILGTAGGVGWWLGSGRYADAPTLEGLAQTAAVAQAKRLGVDVTIAEKSRYDETVPFGHVLDQDPEPGDRFRRGSAITLLISRGPERFTVPNVVGKTQAEAVRLLEAQRLEVGLAPREFSRTVPVDRVIEQNPGPSKVADAKRGTIVTIVVSKGPEPVRVPSVEGRTRAEAEEALSSAGLLVKVREAFHDEVPRGVVIRQDVAAGSTAARGDTVTLTVSKGPELIEVPNVEGLRRDEAERRLKAAGFAVRFIDFPGKRGSRVIEQDPDGGERRRRGSTVTCYLF